MSLNRDMAFPSDSVGKNPTADADHARDTVRSLGPEDPL